MKVLGLLLALGLSASAQTIENQTVTGLETFTGSQVSLKNCHITGPIKAFQAKSVTVEHCYLDLNGQPGVLITEGCPVVSICGNIVTNALTAFQLNGVRSDPNVRIAYNYIGSGFGNKWNDQISIYESSGTPSHQIVIDMNFIWTEPTSPFYARGAGISAGDTGSSYVLVAHNRCGNCNAGVWVPNGFSSTMVDNIVIGRSSQNSYSSAIYMYPGTGYAVGNRAVDFNSHRGYDEYTNYYFGDPIGKVANIVIPSNSFDYESLLWMWQLEMEAERQTFGPQ